MKREYSIFSVIGLLLLLTQTVIAEVRLPAIVSSNMVLQRNTTVIIWGWADAKEKINIETSWIESSIQVEADGEGNWRMELQTTNSKEPQVIKIASKESDITLENILFGEVWLCSGQSNMLQPMKGYKSQPTFGAAMAIAKSRNSNLRLFTVDKFGSKTVMEDLVKYKPWQEATPETVFEYSAVAYFFGQELQEILDVPVGLILTSWGGSTVQAWMSKEVLDSYQKVDLDEYNIEEVTNRIPTALYNAMINPLIPYTIKGALWYQGENNRLEPEHYKKLFPAMVEDWRTQWGIGDFPFYYVQIAPFIYDGNDKLQSPDNSAFIREVQLQCLDLIPNSGIAITMDIGDEFCIHPPRKKEVADRLLFNALNQTYGFQTVDANGPVFDTMKIKEGGITLKFKNAENGLFLFGEISGFEIAGVDQVFYPANASIVDRMDLFVESDQVVEPVAVRYGWRNWVNGSLFDTNLLPASSFRTDQWDDAISVKK